MSDFYQLTNSTTDFKSRSSDIFDKLANLEKQHDIHNKTNSPLIVADDEAGAASLQNPTIPSHAITFKKRSADDSFARPETKWTKYDLDDVNEHHLSDTGNRHALNDFFRTRVKTPDTTEIVEKEEEIPLKPIFQRPTKKQIRTNDNNEEDDDEKNDHFLHVHAPKPVSTNETNADNDNDDDGVKYKLQFNRRKPRGVFSKNEKQPVQVSNEIIEEKPSDEDNDDDDAVNQDQDVDDDDDDDDDEFFEP